MKRLHLLFVFLITMLLLVDCTAQPTSTPSATPLPPTRTLAATVTPSPVPPTATLTPTPLPAPILDNQGVLMAYIPAGAFVMGDNNGYTYERPAHTVNLTQAFNMDVYEVTNASYTECVTAGQCTPPIKYDGMESFTRESYYSNPEYADYPVIWVSWNQAVEYCTWRGGRLPTEAEWEYAARGRLEGKEYPWGDQDPVCTLGALNGANYEDCPEGDTMPVGSFAPNGYGLYDMAGNVWEWVNDWYERYSPETETNPSGPTSGWLRVLRGRAWQNVSDWLGVAFRSNAEIQSQSTLVGFRCVMPIGASPGATSQP